MHSTSGIARVRHLRDMQRRWNAELITLSREDPDRAHHLAEALNDLQQLIDQLEASV